MQATHGEYDAPFSNLWNMSVTKFQENMNARLDEVHIAIQSQLRKLNRPLNSVNVGVRTAVWNEAGGRLLHAFNSVTRRIAKQRNLTLFDIDNDVWGTVDWDYSKEKVTPILRDFIHPTPSLMMTLAQKLLGDLYSKAFIRRGNTSHLSIHPLWLGQGGQPTRYKRVRLIQEESRPPRSDLEYNVDSQVDLDRNPKPSGHILMHSNKHIYLILEHKNDSTSVLAMRRSGPIDSAMRLKLGLSLTDVFTLPHHEATRIPMSNPPPTCLQHIESDVSAIHTTINNPCAFRTTEGVYYLVDCDSNSAGILLRMAPNLDAVTVWGVPAEEVTEDVDPIWIKMVPTGSSIPDIYREGVLIRLHGQKEVYVVMKGKKRLIESVHVMLSHSWDFDQVITVSNVHDFDKLPLGDQLQS